MRESFDAAAVASVRDAELNVADLVLAEHYERTGRRLEIQRSLQFDEQDEALGMDSYCLVTDGGTHYGGVLSWDIGGSTLRIELDTAAASALGASEFRVAFPRSESATVEAMLWTLLS